MQKLIGLLNAQQWKMLGAMLLGSTGPVAWVLTRKLGLSDADAKMWLDAIAMLTPIIAGIFITAGQTSAAQVKAVAAMPPEQFSSVPPTALADLAAALPEETVVAAAGAMPGVEVVVDSTAPAGARAAAHDATVPGVNPV